MDYRIKNLLRKGPVKIAKIYFYLDKDFYNTIQEKPTKLSDFYKFLHFRENCTLLLLLLCIQSAVSVSQNRDRAEKFKCQKRFENSNLRFLCLIALLIRYACSNSRSSRFWTHFTKTTFRSIAGAKPRVTSKFLHKWPPTVWSNFRVTWPWA